MRTSKDENGATVEISEATIYTYDEGTNALLFCQNRNNKRKYTYDNGENILTKKEYAVTLDERSEKVYTLKENGSDSYTYDASGKELYVTGSNVELGNLNPFRYRGYYYDSDIEMYYLQSRYYDPEVGRFINCDDANYIGLEPTVVSYNPFTYCQNDPINYVDPSGYIPKPTLWRGAFRNSYNGKYAVLNNNVTMKATINLARYMFENSKLIDISYWQNRIKVNNNWKKATLSNYTYLNYEEFEPGFYLLNYKSMVSGQTYHYINGIFGLMTPVEWEVYMISKHKTIIRKLKDKIIDRLENETEFDAEDYEIFSMALWDSIGDSFEVDTFFGQLAFYKDLIEIVLDIIEGYQDKEDKYIQKAIKGRSNKYNVLILLRSERTNYQYKRKYFLGRYTWVKLNGKQIKYMY